MATIEKRTRGKVTKWRVRYRDPGDSNPKSITAPDEKTAKGKQGEIEQWHMNNPGKPYPRHGVGNERPPALVWDAAVEWLRDMSRTKAPGTIVRYSEMMQPFFNWLGSEAITLRVLTSESIEQYDAYNQERGIAPSTRRTRIATIEVFRKWLSERPDGWPGLPPVRAILRPAAPAPGVKAPTWKEIDAMIERLDKAGAAYRYAWIARCTGLRGHQIAALRWSHVDLDAGMLRVPVAKSHAETALRREIPLAPVLIEEMSTWDRTDVMKLDRVARARQEDTRKKIGRAWRRAHADKKVREEVFAASEITGRRTGAPLHALRKAFVTGMKRLGGDNEAVEYYVGHAKTVAGVRGHYVDPDALDLPGLVALVPKFEPPKDPPELPVKAEPTNVLAFDPALAAK